MRINATHVLQLKCKHVSVLTINNEVSPCLLTVCGSARTVDKWLAAAACRFINVSALPYYFIGQWEWKFVQSLCKGAGVGDVGDLRGDMIFRARERLTSRLVCDWFSVKAKNASGYQRQTQHRAAPLLLR